MSAQKTQSPGEATPGQLVIDVMRYWGRRVEGQGVRKVTIELEDGSKRKITIPREDRQPAFPAAEGWSTLGEFGGYAGAMFSLTGKRLQVFRVLVGAGDGWLSLRQLKLAAWDEHTEDRTVQNMVSQLRAAIRAGMGWGEGVEPIEADGERYRLAAVVAPGEVGG